MEEKRAKEKKAKAQSMIESTIATATSFPRVLPPSLAAAPPLAREILDVVTADFFYNECTRLRNTNNVYPTTSEKFVIYIASGQPLASLDLRFPRFKRNGNQHKDIDIMSLATAAPFDFRLTILVLKAFAAGVHRMGYNARIECVIRNSILWTFLQKNAKRIGETSDFYLVGG